MRVDQESARSALAGARPEPCVHDHRDELDAEAEHELRRLVVDEEDRNTDEHDLVEALEDPAARD